MRAYTLNMGAYTPMSPRAPTEDCNCLAIRQAARQVTQLYDLALASTGLRATQFSILARLRRMGPRSMGDLAADLVMDRTTLGRNLLPLQRDKLISLVPSKEDRRSKEVHLTAEGQRRLEAADEGWSVAQRTFEEGFGRKRSGNLRDQLRALVRSIGPALEGVAADD